MKMFRKNDDTVRRLLAASLLGLVLAAPGSLLMQAAGAPAGVASAQVQVKRTLKLALGKSAVVRMPAGVKDILLGNPKVAEVVLRSRSTMYVFARKVGQTNVFLLDANGNPIASLDVQVSLDPAPLQRMIDKALPDAHITVETSGDQVILGGTAKTPAEVNKAMQLAERYSNTAGGDGSLFGSLFGAGGASVSAKVVNAIRVTGKDQVTIKVKLAEVQRDVIKQLRTNFSRIDISKGPFSTTSGNGVPSFFTFGFPLGNQTSLGTGYLRYAKDGNTVEGLLNVLERDGLVRLLAEPTLTAISGEAASFMAGGEVPVVVDYDATENKYTYQFKPVGVLLGFTPLVLSEGRISLKVNVEVSEISSRYAQPVGNSSINGIEKRRAATTVELPSGGTLAIAGMLREQTRQYVEGIPGLKNLPILGALFRSRDYQSNQTELVVLATPYIVSPRNEKQFRTPVDRLNIASDYQTVFLGRLHRVYGGNTDAKDGRRVYHGDVGFIVE